jgi:putative tricarboxylic transport membrane protein
MASDRIFGAVLIGLALAYIASAFQIQTSFLTDPVGSKTFPIMIGAVLAICGLLMILKPDAEPEWPDLSGVGRLVFATIVLVGYSYALKPFGFLGPTFVAASILAYQITPRPLHALASGIGLSVGLFVIFRFALGLGLKPFPTGLFG